MPKRPLYIIDNFFADVAEIRNWSLSQNWEKKANTSFKCLNLLTPESIKSTSVKRIANFIGDKYSTTSTHSEFVLYTKRDEAINKENGNWIHSDRNDYIGLVFLSPVIPCDSGLSFYKHTKTGVYRWEQAQGSVLVQKQLKEDSANVADWDEIYNVGNVFNRLILFDSFIFHQAKSYFGNDISNGRLTLNFYF